jgi:hypothetical protein
MQGILHDIGLGRDISAITKMPIGLTSKKVLYNKGNNQQGKRSNFVM